MDYSSILQEIRQYGQTLTVLYTENFSDAVEFYLCGVTLFDYVDIVKIATDGFPTKTYTDTMLILDGIEDANLDYSCIWKTVFSLGDHIVESWKDKCASIYCMRGGAFEFSSNTTRREIQIPDDDLTDCFQGLVLDGHFNLGEHPEYDNIRAGMTEKILVVRANPCDPNHVLRYDIPETVNLLKAEIGRGKEYIVFWSADERIQDEIILKTQVIADMIADYIPEDRIIFLTDDLDAHRVYQELLDKKESFKYRMTMLPGLNMAYFGYSNLMKVNPNLPLDTTTPRPFRYLMYSRMPRSIRMSTLGFLFQNNLVDQGLISFTEQHIFDNPNHLGFDTSKFEPNDMEIDILRLNEGYYYELQKNRHLFPLTLDILNITEVNSCDLTTEGLKHHQSSYFTLVLETDFYQGNHNQYKLHGTDNIHSGGFNFTEKTYKPMACKSPFLLFSSPGALRRLRKLGFKTFSGLIDETYDLIEHDGLRMMALHREIKRLCALTDTELLSMLEELREILEHNFKHLININETTLSIMYSVDDTKQLLDLIEDTTGITI